MSMSDFILNGGLLGMLRGFDHEAEGRIYGFPEFNEDMSQVLYSLEETTAKLAEIEAGLNAYTQKLEM